MGWTLACLKPSGRSPGWVLLFLTSWPQASSSLGHPGWQQQLLPGGPKARRDLSSPKLLGRPIPHASEHNHVHRLPELKTASRKSPPSAPSLPGVLGRQAPPPPPPLPVPGLLPLARSQGWLPRGCSRGLVPSPAATTVGKPWRSLGHAPCREGHRLAGTADEAPPRERAGAQGSLAQPTRSLASWYLQDFELTCLSPHYRESFIFSILFVNIKILKYLQQINTWDTISYS